jgi:hypothetical protein
MVAVLVCAYVAARIGLFDPQRSPLAHPSFPMLFAIALYLVLTSVVAYFSAELALLHASRWFKR